MKPILKLAMLCAAMLLSQPRATRAATTVTNLGAGAECSFFIRSDGSLWGAGYDYNGQLGNGTNTTVSPYGIISPEQIVPGGVTAVTGGAEHSLFIRSDGSLWTMGYNPYGELGNGSYLSTNTPQPITVASNVSAIAGGFLHSLFLETNGSVWAMGDNTYGQLGAGATYSKTNTPQEILSSNVTAIAAGDYYSLCLKSDGSLWAFGANGSGQLGTSNYLATNAPVQVVASNVTAISAGTAHSLFIKTDGSLWAMGDNTYGQLGRGNNLATNAPVQIVASNVTAISAGSYHSLFLKSNGSLWGMGLNSSGQLGDGHSTNTNAPEQIVASNVTAIAAGRYFSLFLKSDGSLQGMGYNRDGELGDGTTTFRYSPVQVVPALQFTADPTIGVALLTVQFNAPGADNAGNTITQWNWNFGDGATSTAQNPAHVYSNAATFIPTLVATNDTGASVPATGPSISVSLPTVQFTADTNLGIAPLVVQFTVPPVDSGSNTIVNWNWNFGDGSTSTAQNPLHTYNTNGTYFPGLMATNSQGTPVTASGPPITVASYSGLVLNGNLEAASFIGWSNTSFFTYPVTGPLYAHSGNYGFRLFQPPGPLGFLSQTLATTAGKYYVLSFWLDSPDGATPNEFQVSWDGNTLFDATNLTAIGWTNMQFTVAATSDNTVLQFGFESFSGFNGFGLDDISVVPLVTPQLNIVGITLMGTNLVINGVNGLAGKTYHVLMSTNAASALDQWTPVATNVLGGDGNFTINATNVVNPGAAQRFYILQSQ